MSKKSIVRSVGAVMLFAVLLFALPAEASHRDGGYSSSVERKIRALDDDLVEAFPLPVLFGVSIAGVRPDFGDPRGGGTRTHEGQDILAPEGTPIVSPTEAVVILMGTGESAGKYVYTANPGGETFRYMHLADIADIRVGDVLDVGDFIGTVGNTGNAQGGPAHLHFEIRDGEALDPHPRLSGEFTLKEKASFLENIIKKSDDEEDMASFLVKTFRSELASALNASFDLPEEVTDALADAGIVSLAALEKQLQDIIASIPKVVTANLTIGAGGVDVSLMQTYLIMNGKGPAHDALVRAGATGYFGPVTAAALLEYQSVNELTMTSMYDAETRAHMQGA